MLLLLSYNFVSEIDEKTCSLYSIQPLSHFRHHARHSQGFYEGYLVGDFNAPDFQITYSKQFTDSGGTRTHSLRISLLYQLEVRRAIHCATEPGHYYLHGKVSGRITS